MIKTKNIAITEDLIKFLEKQKEDWLISQVRRDLYLFRKDLIKWDQSVMSNLINKIR